MSEIPTSKDPSHTSDLRNAYERKARHRYNLMIDIVEQTFVKNGALDDMLSRRVRIENMSYLQRAKKIINGMFDDDPDIEPVDFMKSKSSSARDIQERVTGFIDGNQQTLIVDGDWHKEYTEKSYQRGIFQTESELENLERIEQARGIHSAVRSPFHKDALKQIKNRQIKLFATVQQDLTDDLAPRIRETLVKGYTKNWTGDEIQEELARQIKLRTEALAKTRAEAITQTEIVDANTQARINNYQERGIKQLYWQPSNEPCPICQGYYLTNPFKPSEISAMFPAHPHEKCSVVAAPLVK